MVSIGGILVGHEFRVLPYTDYVREEYESGFGVRGGAIGGRSCEVGFDSAGELGGLAGGCTTDMRLATVMW